MDKKNNIMQQGHLKRREKKMLIAAVIDEKETILPIVEGTILRIFDTETSRAEDFPNPAVQLKTGRRGATLQFAEEKGATTFVAPPNTFCELSYKAAQEDKVEFIHIPSDTAFPNFKQSFLNGEIKVQAFLPDKEILPS